jgi:hypothetical protein
VTKGPLGYGRYNDDPDTVGCPRAVSDMTPCVARDGEFALADDQRCVGCRADPRKLLTELRHEVTGESRAQVTIASHAASRLKALVREVTEPETKAAKEATDMIIAPWWKFIVLRGDGVPARMNGLWLDISDLGHYGPMAIQQYGYQGLTFEVTNQWEQRDDGQVAVVVRYFPELKGDHA